MNDDLNTFLSTFNISEADFESSGLIWNDLLLIKQDYKSIKKELNLIARYIEEIKEMIAATIETIEINLNSNSFCLIVWYCFPMAEIMIVKLIIIIKSLKRGSV